eukprot:576156-Alexandrium_andersonii.AAC.1
MKVSKAKQRALFRRSVGGACSDCPWRGHRGSEMARGHASVLVGNVARANSPKRQNLLARLGPEQRAI